MKQYIQAALVLIFLHFSIRLAYAQGNPSTLILNTAETTSQIHTACKRIELKPGYSFHAGSGRSMQAHINEFGVCNTEYNPGGTGSGTNPRVLDTSLPVGSSEGSGAVSTLGAVQYSIPILAPPGTGGMMPHLSIQYNSHSGNGMLGMGWTLSGLSSIRRENLSLYYNERLKAVELNIDDDFSLDGSRLIRKTGTLNGEDGTTFATEMESFTRITGHGVGPLSFTVEMKDGTVMEYGGTEDSRIEGQGATSVLTWLISKVTDTRGNYMLFHYYEDNASGEYRIDNIEYGGNTDAGISPYNQVKFRYSTRDDIQYRYVNGSKEKESTLLTGIILYAENNRVHEYALNYIFDRRSKLSEVIEKGTDGQAYNSTQITWNASPQATVVTSGVSYPVLPLGARYYGDMTGDGLADIFEPVQLPGHSVVTTYNVYANSGQGGFNKISTGNITNEYSATTVVDNNEIRQSIDMDGNGFQDVLITADHTTFDLEVGYEKDSKVYTPYYSNGQGLTPGKSLQEKDVLQGNNKKESVGDFDGDGATDLMILNYDNQTAVFYSFRNDIHYENKIPSTSLATNIFPIDRDGDGKMEMLLTYVNESRIYSVFDSSGVIDIVNYLTLPGITYNDKLYFGDYNGDGKTDIIRYNTQGGWQIAYSTGKGYAGLTPLPVPNNGFPERNGNIHNYITADMNGDGMEDFLDIYPDSDQQSSHIDTYYGDQSLLFKLIPFQTNPADLIILYNPSSIHLGDFDGDGHTDILYKENNSYNYAILITFYGSTNIDRVSSISNGLGRRWMWSCAPLPQLKTQGKYQAVQTLATYPVQSKIPPIWVATSMKTDDGIGGLTTEEYSYGGLKIHVRGKGLLGFESRTAKNLVTGALQVNNFSIGVESNYYTPVPTTSQVSILGIPVSSTTCSSTFSPRGGRAFYMYKSNEVVQDLLRSITTTSQYQKNTNGNTTSEVVQYGSDATTTTTYTWETKAAWTESRLKSTSVSISRSGQTYARTADYDNDSRTGLHLKETRDIATAKPVVTTYVYNPSDANNPSVVTVTGSGMAPRQFRYQYDPYKRYAERMYNPLNQITETLHEPVYGNVLSSKDANGLVATYTYDGFGRLTQAILPTGHISTITRGWALSSGIANAIYAVTTKEQENGASTQYADLLGRTLHTQKNSFSGGNIHMGMQYNAKGQLERQSLPYLDGASPLYTTFLYYDDMRLRQQRDPSGESTTLTYNGTTTSQKTTITSRTSETETDATGLVRRVTDPSFTSSVYEYHPCGKPKKITTAGIITTMEYDNFGMQTALNDQDLGPTTYDYDALGELTTQTDAKGSTYTMTYDNLGRMTKSQGPEGTIVYTFDTQPKGIGQLANVQSFGGITQTYAYDEFSRLKSLTEQIGGTPYTSTYTYDIHNRVIKMVYASGFAVNQTFNSFGYLNRISRADNGALIWQCKGMNEFDQTTDFVQGNNLISSRSFTPLGLLKTLSVSGNPSGLTPAPGTLSWEYDFDPVTGNLLSRSDKLRSLTEQFSYDNLDRLTRSLPASQPEQTVGYAPSGNITSKSDVGTYKYNGTQPHGVCCINGAQSGIPTLNQDVTYTPFKKAETINLGQNTLTIAYGPDYERRKQVLTQTDVLSSRIVETKYYTTSYEKDVFAGGLTRELSYIKAGNEMCAIHVKNAGQDSLYYLHLDHLGSLAAVTNQQGNKLADYSYDAWGRRRNAADWTYATSGITATHVYFDRGYTLHEQLELFGLINMNGRMYDPALGRMLSPDMAVQDPANTQNYNRYSYAWNNPLKYTDPTGNLIDDYDFYSNDGTDYVTITQAPGEDTFSINGKKSSFKDLSSDLKDAYSFIHEGFQEGRYSFSYPAINLDKSGNSVTLGFLSGAEVVGYTGSSYGGDGSGGLYDYAMYDLNMVNQVNPFSNGLDVFNYLTRGTNRNGIEMSGSEAAMSALAAIPFESLEVGAAKQISVIGPRATYREFAKEIGANYLNVTDETWTMSKNMKFLRGVVNRGDDVIFAGKFDPALLGKGSVLGKEIKYLESNGYQWTSDFTKMILKQ